MIVETIVGENFDGETDSFLARFHISEAVLMEHMTMRDKLQRMTELLSGPQRALRMEEIQEMIDMVKFFMSISYGIKSIDGSIFEQDQVVGEGPIWQSFKNSWAYSKFLMSLFKPDPIKLTEFILRVLPQELKAEAEEAARSGDNPQLLAAMQQAERAQAKQPVERLPVGSRIVDGQVELPPSSAPVAPTTPSQSGADEVDPNMDYEALLNQEPEEPKRPIKQGEYDKMKNSLKPAQFEHFMSTRYVAE